jgi:hypothetical protein
MAQPVKHPGPPLPPQPPLSPHLLPPLQFRPLLRAPSPLCALECPHPETARRCLAAPQLLRMPHLSRVCVRV